MTYTEENCIEEVLKVLPGFRQRWQEHMDYWEGEKAGLTLDMIELAAYTSESLEMSREQQELEKVFDLMEIMLREGTEEVKNAVASGFLESTVNSVTKDTPYLQELIRLLGTKSREYSQEWLKFAGGDLPGM